MAAPVGARIAGENRLSGAQRRKLGQLLAGAVSDTPLYGRLYAPLGLSPAELADPGVIGRLPVLTKAALLASSPEERVSARFRRSALARESTTGSTGQPLSVYLDRRYVRRRNLRFLRALLAVGYRPWHRLLLLTDRHPGFSRHHGWYYQSVEENTRRLVETCARVRPDVLYGFTTPLRLLAAAARTGALASRPRLVVSTAEMLDDAGRAELEEAFACPVADFYGMTETGLVAWRPPGADSFTVADDSILLELLPEASSPGRYRVVLTNLDLRASPVIRFDSGDLASAEPRDGAWRITGFEGRVIDSLALRDGTRLSPYRVTDALRDVPGLRRFKVTQVALTRFEVAVEAGGSRDDVGRRIRAKLAALLGADVEVEVRLHERLVAEGALKFRPVESMV